MSLINARELRKVFGTGDAAVNAIRDISFDIEAGEFVAVTGISGAGKSTLLDILGAMSAPSSGKLWVDDIDIYSLESEKKADFRREFLGFVFQSFYLLSYLTVLENVMLPLATTGLGKRPNWKWRKKPWRWSDLKIRTIACPTRYPEEKKSVLP